MDLPLQRGSIQVHSQLMLVAPSGQSQLILVKNRADCRLGFFHFKVTPSVGLVSQSPNVLNRPGFLGD
ncbi:hypothetical protein, partial [Pseudomonas amygdali]|uniref:hypothetical protein n=1 Tax=Pseudomonas amygdali TaxID=47877 RepID=UPI001EE3FD15